MLEEQEELERERQRLKDEQKKADAKENTVDYLKENDILCVKKAMEYLWIRSKYYINWSHLQSQKRKKKTKKIRDRLLVPQKKGFQKNLVREMKKRNRQRRAVGNHLHGQRMYWMMMAVYSIIDLLIAEQLERPNTIKLDIYHTQNGEKKSINQRNMQRFSKKLTMKLHELRLNVNVFSGNKMN